MSPTKAHLQEIKSRIQREKNVPNGIENCRVLFKRQVTLCLVVMNMQHILCGDAFVSVLCESTSLLCLSRGLTPFRFCAIFVVVIVVGGGGATCVSCRVFSLKCRFETARNAGDVAI